MEKNTNRIPWIDELRGLSVLAMILHHAAFNIIYYTSIPSLWISKFLAGNTFLVIQTGFIAVFLGLSGICSHFSRRPFYRAGKVLFGAAAVSLVTYYLFPEEVVVFGILHLLGTSMLLAAVLRRFAVKIPALWGFLISLFLFFLTFHVPDGFLGFGSFSVSLSPHLYQGGFLTALGFPKKFFTTLDYVPLLPYVFLFLAGFSLGFLSLPKGKSHVPFLAFCGRHSLWIYLLHQPLLYGICFLLEKLQ